MVLLRTAVKMQPVGEHLTELIGEGESMSKKEIIDVLTKHIGFRTKEKEQKFARLIGVFDKSMILEFIHGSNVPNVN